MLRRFSSTKSKSNSKSKSKAKSKTKKAPLDETQYSYHKTARITSHENTLLVAAKVGDDETILDLFLKRKDLTVTDSDGNTALHIAALNGHKYVCKMIVVLAAPNPIWKARNKKGKTAMDLASTEEIGDDLHLLGHDSVRKDDVYTQWNSMILKKKKEWRPSDLSVLTLDGGGSRGFLQAQMLLHLERKIDGKLMDYVDWIAGTSVGGLLAIMLSSGYSLSFIRQTLFTKLDKVFCGNKVKVPKHDSKGIESIAKGILGDARMSSIHNKRVLIPVANAQVTPVEMILFRSYVPRVSNQLKEKHGYLAPERIITWKAARCTSAAPYFFDTYNGMTDGGLVANNPSQAVISDFLLMSKLEMFYGETEKIKKEAEERKLGCFISLGTGILPVEKTDGIDVNLKILNKPWKLAKNIMSMWKTAKNALQVLIKECTSTNGQPAKYAREWCHSLEIPYFRFTPNLSRDVPLDTTDMEIIISMLFETEVYLSSADAIAEMDALAELLLLRHVTTADDTAIEDDEDGSSSKNSAYSQRGSSLSSRLSSRRARS